MTTKLSLAIFLFFLLALSSNLALGGTKENEVEDHDLKGNIRKIEHNPEQEEETRVHKREEEREEEEQKEEGEEEENPYVFEQHDFDIRAETEGGRIGVLHKFTEKSKLLSGIQNYRLAILEAKAHTFVAPRHFDSDVVLFVIKGTYIQTTIYSF